jgi:ribonucleoside-diphosphate reductase beta chain
MNTYTTEKTQIQQPRVVYKPFQYPKYFEYYKRSVSTVWRAETVDMNSDVKDYSIRSTEDEKEIIAGILKGFTILETHIGDYWSDRVCKIFPKHEIIAAARANAFFECIHAQAYAHLNDSLGLDDYEAFLTDPVTRTKIEYFVEHPNDLVSLAIFSGAGEGVSLFSSFAVLLSLSRDSRYKGLAQIISWSVRDEHEHSEMGCELFRDLVLERGITKEETQMIYKGFDTVLSNEFEFIDTIFEGRTLENLREEELKDYMRLRANNRLKALGFEERYTVGKEAYVVKDWFENEAFGQSSNDFFWQSLSGDNYTSLLSQNFEGYDYSNVSLEWKD